MIHTRYLYEIEITANGWILREMEEKPKYVNDSQGSVYSGHYAGTEREVTTYVYGEKQYRDMLQHVVGLTYRGDGNTPRVELIENE